MSAKPELVPLASNRQRRAALEKSDHSGEVFEQTLIAHNSPDELAMAVEQLTALAKALSDTKITSYTMPGNTANVWSKRLRLILSRLAKLENEAWLSDQTWRENTATIAAQEETIRADGVALKPFARDADGWPEKADTDTLALTDPDGTASAYDITVGDLRAARARLSARQEGGAG